MGPSLAAREPRRSSRRPNSIPVPRSSISPPGSLPALPSPRTPTPSAALPLLTHKRSNSSSKRVKLEQEDSRNPMDDATIPTTNGRSKRKSKDKVDVVLPSPIVPEPPTPNPIMSDVQDDNDDDGGITRCVCGRTDADEEELGFMVQCETCKVWQHGVCVNLRQEDANDLDYYCEQCRPDLHVDTLKSLKKRVRHPPKDPQPNARRHSVSVPRSSRSHSPGHVLATTFASTKAPKRRNTMNSRDAAYEDALKELIESTRPDAEKDTDGHPDKDELVRNEEPGVIIEIVSGARKKRKRTTVDKENTNAVMVESADTPGVTKRNRSNSSTPDRPIASTLGHRDTTVNGVATNGTTISRHVGPSSGPGGIKSSSAGGPSKSKRGRKDATASADNTDAISSKKHPNQYTYRKPAAQSSASGVSVHDHGTRRNAHAPHLHAPSAPQPPFTSWGLPDYLAHLASALPSEVPRALEVRVLDTEGEAPVEVRVLERGVKVKWPAKRTSVSDMNKRVRGIIDWVGREQAVALERQRRREALRKGREAQQQTETPEHADGAVDVCAEQPKSRPVEAPGTATGTTHLMEELMKELIAFQERFGPGAKAKEQRERRGAGS